MTDTDPQKLAELLAKATPGPWLRIDKADYAEVHAQFRPSSQAVALVGKVDDVDLIVAAVNALPALLDRLTELEAQVSASDARVAEATKQPYDYRTENGTPKSPKQSKKAKWQ